MDNAAAAGVVVVASAGNDSTNESHSPSDYDSVLGVIATDWNDVIADYSNYGSEKDISAPGGSVTDTLNSRILSTYKGGQYAWMAGTSMASPVVAGVAALIWSADPSLTAEEVKSLICDTAVDLGTVGLDGCTVHRPWQANDYRHACVFHQHQSCLGYGFRLCRL